MTNQWNPSTPLYEPLPSPPPAPPKRRWGLVVAVVVVALALLGAGAALGGGAQEQVSSSRSDALDNVAAPEVEHTTTTIDQRQTDTAEWLNANLAVSDDLVSAFGDVADAAGTGDLYATADACRTLKSVVQRARSVAFPAPSAALEYELTQAYDFTEKSADYCISGAQNFDIADIEQSTYYADQATIHINNAADEIGNL